MVDSRQKGARAEGALVTLLKKDTGLNWKRVPGSGALHEDHGLKGDVYVPNEKNYWAIEVKHYKDSHISSKILTDKESQLNKWWVQAVRQAKQTDKEPILFFKHDRSKWFVMLPAEQFDSFKCDKSLLLWPMDTIVVTYDTFKKYYLPEIQWIK